MDASASGKSFSLIKYASRAVKLIWKPLSNMFSKTESKNVNPSRVSAEQGFDPDSLFCKFENTYNNCWLNSTMQALLNIRVIRKALLKQNADALQGLSFTPVCAKMFLKALHNPGCTLSNSDIYPVLEELSHIIPTLILAESNDIADFLEPFLGWLIKCGVDLDLRIQHTDTCAHCQRQTNGVKHMGYIIYLSPPSEDDTMESLLQSAISEVVGRQSCDGCSASLRKKIAFSRPDVLTLYLPRSPFRKQSTSVTPGDFIHLPVSGHLELYRLSAVICHHSLSKSGHFYTYVFLDQATVITNDRFLFMAGEDGVSDIEKNGVVFFYERSAKR